MPSCAEWLQHGGPARKALALLPVGLPIALIVELGLQLAEDVEERLCVICLVNDRDTTVLPCRHMCMCHECAQELRKQTSKCPICRNQVESLLHIRMQRRGAESKPGQGPPALLLIYDNVTLQVLQA